MRVDVLSALLVRLLRPAFVRAIRRVLAPGGRLGCLSSLGEIADISLTCQGWKSLLASAGFADVEVEDGYAVLGL